MLNLKRIIGIFLTAAILTVMFSCAKDGSGSTNSGNTTAADNTAADSTASTTNRWDMGPSDLPQKDFGGQEFNVITAPVTDANRMYDKFSADDQTGEPINDALYKRRLDIEDAYNIKLTTTENSAPAAAAKKSVLAGDNTYALVVDTIGNTVSLASQSLLTDFYTVPYVKDDLSKPWWDQALIRDLSINGKLYFEAGDIVLRDKLRSSCTYFNKDMCKSLGIEFPYQYVNDGTWTIDKLLEITKGVNKDLNGDGVMGQDDQWGFMSQYEFGLHLFEASGEKTVSLDQNNVPVITINNDRALNVIQKVLTVCADPTAMFMADTIKGASDIWVQASADFEENRFLMRASLLEPVVRDLRAMPTDFGILPTPKFDANQQNYYTYAEMSGLVVSIPNTADPEFSGFITEALAYESGSTLMPAFYDLCLTSKVLRDDESEGMLDIIFNNKVYDIGYIYQIGTLPTMLNTLVQGGKTDFVSAYDKAQGAVEKALQKFIDSYNK
ncbi:MAG: hypothetical protein FWD71_20470 [Oscillospiraceae bacterium]|nr:hypothetical protein [Oscillospiraceae bacterium]